MPTNIVIKEPLCDAKAESNHSSATWELALCSGSTNKQRCRFRGPYGVTVYVQATVMPTRIKISKGNGRIAEAKED